MTKTRTIHDDEKILTAAVAEVLEMGHQTLLVEADLTMWFDLISMVQLGLRVPGSKAKPAAQRSEIFIRNLIDLIDPERGNIWQLLQMGFDPDHDR